MFAKFKKDIIGYLLMKEQYCSHNIVHLAQCNRIDLCEIVYSETDAFNGIDSVVDQASHDGNFEIVKCLTEMGASCSTYSMNWAACNGNLEVVKWLHFNRSEGCTTKAMEWAACNGNLEVVKWLHFNRSEGCTTEAMDLAAQYGHLDIVKWLHLNRSEGCTTDSMRLAAQSEHINVVKYLYENGLVSDRDSLRCAMGTAKRNRYTDIEIYLESALKIE